jgi:hypothetical protein
MSFLLLLLFTVGLLVTQMTGGIFQAVNASTPPAVHVRDGARDDRCPGLAVIG